MLEYATLTLMHACVHLQHRDHPELGKAMIGKPAVPGEPMRLACGLYYDGLGLANPLGVAAGRCVLVQI